MSSDNHPDTWVVQLRRDHGKYEPIFIVHTAGAAMGAYGRLETSRLESKRLLKNGKVISREKGPTPRVRPPRDTRISWEYGVLTSVARDTGDILPALDEDNCIDISVQVKRGGLRAQVVRRSGTDTTWRDFNGKRADLLIEEWSKS